MGLNLEKPDLQQNIMGVVASFGLIGAILFLSFLLNKAKFDPEFVRKIVHIGVSNWWFVNIHYFTDYRFSIVAPIVFIFANAFATFTKLTDIAFGQTSLIRNLGLIYFPISLLVLVLLSHYNYITLVAAGVGVLVMGYGDGLAGILGKRYGKRKLLPTKSYVGIFTMFTTSFFVSLVFPYSQGYWEINRESIIGSLICGIIAILTELIPTIDNLTVPISVALVFHYVSKYVLTP